MKYYLLLAAIFGWLITPIITVSAHVADAYPETVEKHDEAEDHAHADGDEHNEHGEETDNHEDHGHDAHQEQDDHDGHGHGSTKPEEGHEEGEDEHGEHEEGKAEISPDAAKLTGIQVQQAGSVLVAMTTPLTGRITLNENTTANVRARFPGFVKAVHVSLGDTVTKGQKLATVESNESLKTYSVTAPMDGVILRRETNIGDVTDGKELFVIADLSTVWAKYHIFPRDVASIKKGQPVVVHTLDEKTRQNAQISMLFPTTDALSQTVIAIAELPNENGVWRPGMTIEGDIKVGEKQAAIAVPRDALQFMEDQQVVFVKSGNTYEPRPVSVGMTGTDNAEITSGLKRGETYVSAGSFVIKADILKGTAAHEH